MPDLSGKKTAYYGFTGIIEPESVTRIAAAFNYAVNDRRDEIYLCLSSIGGSVADGIYLYNHIKSLPVTVTIHNTGNISSIATAIYVAADVRNCSAHGVFMIHPTEMPQKNNMRAETLSFLLDAALADDQRIEDILRQRASIPDKILTSRRFKDVHISPEKAVEFGLADSISEFELPDGNEVMQIGKV